jgi:hypothetical protein
VVSEPAIDIDALTGYAPLAGFLEDDPIGRRALFESFIPQNVFGTQRQRLSNLFTPTFNRFLGELGTEVRAGGAGFKTPKTFRESLLAGFDPTRERLRFPVSATRASPMVTPTQFRFPT